MKAVLVSCVDVDEECSAMVADSLGQMALMAPADMFAWLLAQLAAESASVRSAAVAAMRHLLNDAPPGIEQHIGECGPSPLRPRLLPRPCSCRRLVLSASWRSVGIR